MEERWYRNNSLNGYFLFLLIVLVSLPGCYIESLPEEGYVSMDLTGDMPKGTESYDVDFAFYYPENMQWSSAEDIYNSTESEEEVLANAVPIRGLPKLTITMDFGMEQTEGTINVEGIPAGTYQMIVHTADEEGTYIALTEEPFTIEAGKTKTVSVVLYGFMEFEIPI